MPSETIKITLEKAVGGSTYGNDSMRLLIILMMRVHSVVVQSVAAV